MEKADLMLEQMTKAQLLEEYYKRYKVLPKYNDKANLLRNIKMYDYGIARAKRLKP